MKLEAAAAVLGVSVDADPETLKAAYRRLALRWHPDKCKDADAKERFQEVRAYSRRPRGACVFVHTDKMCYCLWLATQPVFNCVL